MLMPPILWQWNALLKQHLPHLTKPQVDVLAQYSLGVVLAQYCGLETVAQALVSLLGQSQNTIRQRLREWYQPAEAKTGSQRRQLEVSSCFAPLLRWIVESWPASCQPLMLAMDATPLKNRFVVLVIAVVLEKTAIPVAWKVLKAEQPGQWKPLWLDLLAQLKPAVPSDWKVMVSADRGLFAPWLFEGIVQNGWHPLLRVNTKSGPPFRAEGQTQWHDPSTFVPTIGSRYQGHVECGKHNRLKCTLLGCWGAGYAQPWLVVTDLEPHQVEPEWYGYRSWIEAGFKDGKSGGWGWQYTRMDAPERVERLWLVLSVASLWALQVGTQQQTQSARATAKPQPRRRLSCFLVGVLAIVTALAQGQVLCGGHFKAQPWTTLPAVEIAQQPTHKNLQL
jgi:Transposase DDE domain